MGDSALADSTAKVTATVYVSRYFEIRDYDQPAKYVFNGSTRVAHAVGSLSGNARLQRLRLFPGWNLCSLAVTGPFPASGGESISAAYQWVQTASNYSPVNIGQTLPAGTVLWVKAKTNATLAVIGTYSDPATEQVQPGGAYTSCPGLEVWTPDFPPTLSTWLFDPQAGQWDSQLAGDLISLSDVPAVLSPGQAFYAKSDSAVPLAIPDPKLRIRYYHEDHLGSSSALTDSSGVLVEEIAYYPFGIPRYELQPREAEERYQFAEKERDRESGLHYFEARFIVAGRSRFLSPDSKFANPDLLATREFLSTPQNLNLYAYVLNNPLRYRDPTGLDKSSSEKEEEPSGLEEMKEGAVSFVTAGAERQGARWAQGTFNKLAYVPKPDDSGLKMAGGLVMDVGVTVVAIGAFATGMVVGEVEDVGHVVRGAGRALRDAVTAPFSPDPLQAAPIDPDAWKASAHAITPGQPARDDPHPWHTPAPPGPRPTLVRPRACAPPTPPAPVGGAERLERGPLLYNPYGHVEQGTKLTAVPKQTYSDYTGLR